MANNTPSVPRDGNNAALPLTPNYLALHVTTNASISGSSSVTLQAGTSLIEVNAISQGIYMKWSATASSSAFDEYIQAGSTRHYVVPPGVTTVQFIQQAASATLVLIEK